MSIQKFDIRAKLRSGNISELLLFGGRLVDLLVKHKFDT